LNSDFNIALHALVFLDHEDRELSSAALAENICAHPTRVRKILSRLGQSGLILTKEGRFNGGYRMGKRADRISLREVCEAVGTCFASTNWKSGDPRMKCLVASGMAGIMDELYGKLDETCKKELEKISVKDIENKIFREGT